MQKLARRRAVVRIVAASLVSVAVGALGIASGPYPTENGSAPVIDVPDTVQAGFGLYGTATDPDSPLTVQAKVGTTHLGNSPDSTQDGNVNSFCFPVGSELAGSTITVTATDGQGISRTVLVSVVN